VTDRQTDRAAVPEATSQHNHVQVGSTKYFATPSITLHSPPYCFTGSLDGVFSQAKKREIEGKGQGLKDC
jgi:hypothetical protein